jgi:hypothetical protein
MVRLGIQSGWHVIPGAHARTASLSAASPTD